MSSVNILTILFLVNAVYAGTMRQIVQDVISHTAGVPDKGIHALDPVIIEHFHVPEELGFTSHFSNMKVTGFKNVKMSDYLEEDDKVKFTLKLDFTAEGPVRVEFKNKDKSLNGDLKYEGGATGIISYSYTKKNENGKDVYELGTHDIWCESEHAKSTLSDELSKALANDPEAQAQQAKYDKEVKSGHQERVVCEITKAVYEKAFENLKIAGHLGGL